MQQMKVRDLFASLREGRFTSLGCYPKFYVTADGGVLSHAAIVENIWSVGRATRDRGTDKQWEVIAVDVNWEDPDLYCDHTNERIESAYAEG